MLIVLLMSRVEGGQCHIFCSSMPLLRRHLGQTSHMVGWRQASLFRWPCCLVSLAGHVFVVCRCFLALSAFVFVSHCCPLLILTPGLLTNRKCHKNAKKHKRKETQTQRNETRKPQKTPETPENPVLQTCLWSICNCDLLSVALLEGALGVVLCLSHCFNGQYP